LKSMEQGNTFRSVEPKYPTKDPDYRIVKKSRSRGFGWVGKRRGEKRIIPAG
jgi:hypothetical protein